MKTAYSESATRELMKEIKLLVTDLGFDYGRMSKSGQQIYDELCEKLGIDLVMNTDFLHKFGEIQYLKGRIDELHKALPTVLDLSRKRKLDVRLEKYYNKLKETDEMAYHLYLVERENQLMSKRKSKKEMEELLNELMKYIKEDELINKIQNQIEKYE